MQQGGRKRGRERERERNGNPFSLWTQREEEGQLIDADVAIFHSSLMAKAAFAAHAEDAATRAASLVSD